MKNTKRKPCRLSSTGFSLWRSRRDSNPRYAFDVHTISSRARYDRFDTTPYSIVRGGCPRFGSNVVGRSSLVIIYHESPFVNCFFGKFIFPVGRQVAAPAGVFPSPDSHFLPQHLRLHVGGEGCRFRLDAREASDLAGVVGGLHHAEARRQQEGLVQT